MLFSWVYENIVFSYLAQKYRLWLLFRTTSIRRFSRVPQFMIWANIMNIIIWKMTFLETLELALYCIFLYNILMELHEQVGCFESPKLTPRVHFLWNDMKWLYYVSLYGIGLFWLNVHALIHGRVLHRKTCSSGSPPSKDTHRSVSVFCTSFVLINKRTDNNFRPILPYKIKMLK